MAENVGHAEVDVELDVDSLIRQGRDAGAEAGEAYGEQFFRDANGRLRDARGRFVNDSGRSGTQAGTAFGRGFSRGLNRTFSGGGNPFSGLESQAQLQTSRILAIFVRLGPAIAAAIGAAFAVGPAFAAGLPALAAMAGIIGVIVLGWDQVVEAVKPLQNMFTKLQKPIGRILTEGIRPLVAELAEGLLPVLKTGLGDIAASVNVVAESFLRWLSSTDTLSQLQALLTGVAPVIETLGAAAVELSDAFLQIAVAAIPAFQMLADVLLTGATSFNDWITGLAQTGELTSAISGSMETLIGILESVGRVAAAAIGFFADLGPAGVAAFQGLADVLVVVIEALRPMAQFLSQNTESVRQFATVLGALLIASAGLQIIALVLSGAVGALSALAAGLVVAYNNSEAFRIAVQRLAEWAQTQLIPAIQAVADWVQTVLIPALGNFIAYLQANVFPVVQQLFNWFVAIGIAIGQFAAFLGPVFAALLQFVVPAFEALADAVRDFAEALGPALKPLLILVGGGLLLALVGALAVLIAAVYIAAAVFRVLTAVINAVRDAALWLWHNVLQPLAAFIGGALSGAFRNAAGVAAALVGAFQTVIGTVAGLVGGVQRLVGWLLDIPGNIPNPITWVLDNVLGWVSDIFGWLSDILGLGILPNPLDWPLDGVVGLISDVADLLGSIPESLPNPFAGWSIPDIPTDLGGVPGVPWEGWGPGAYGGIFNTATPRIIGEAGKEVLVPLTKPSRALQLMEASGAADMVRDSGKGKPDMAPVQYFGAQELHVHVPTDDPETVAEQTANRIASRVVS